MTDTERKFDIGNLNGISTKTIEEHLKLYSGYVKNTNLIIAAFAQLKVQMVYIHSVPSCSQFVS
jgi:hypothetical protein